MLEEAYTTLVQTYEALNKYQENYAKLVEEATIKAQCKYLEKSFNLYKKAQVACSQVLNQRERAKSQEGFEAAKSKAVAGMEAFRSFCKVLNKIGSSKVLVL